MSLQLNAHQTALIRAARDEFVANAQKQDALKAEQKEAFESLFSGLGFDKTVDGDNMKAIKHGFKLYYKETVEASEAVMNDAVVVATL